jgi:hypothetical protein
MLQSDIWNQIREGKLNKAISDYKLKVNKNLCIIDVYDYGFIFKPTEENN